MEEFVFNLFHDQETWRLQAFIDKMKSFKRECTINQEESFIKAGLHYAEKMLAERANQTSN